MTGGTKSAKKTSDKKLLWHRLINIPFVVFTLPCPVLCQQRNRQRVGIGD
jgi:hypothetical protein